MSYEDLLVMLHIDFEVQNEYVPANLTYPITKRGVYYAARELSSQLGVITSEANYGRLEKVYSIWICNEEVPKELKNTITRYYVNREDVIGTCNEPEEYHDLLEVIIVRRGEAPLKDTVFEYLHGIFSREMTLIEKYVDVGNQEVKEAIKTMCGMGESIAREGFEQGIEQGIEQGKFLQLAELVEKKLLSLENASKEAGLTAEEFAAKIKNI